MSNAFVDYLNYMNNAGSDTAGALAEYQATNPFYEKIRIERTLGTNITNTIRANYHQAYILTGHAGDGKTSILLQILRDLNITQDGEPLKETDSFTGDGHSVYYVKDMSEISQDKQVQLLKNALEAPSHGQSSILISNTGPLLKCFEELYANTKGVIASEMAEVDRIAVQSILLSQLDENQDTPISAGPYKFKLINIARIDNVPFAKKVLGKIVDPSLWSCCTTCPKAACCPIYHNIQKVHNSFDRVAMFIENYYRFLYENDKRLTIRQILSHMSFALTGNLTCSRDFASMKHPLFDYDLANLFFGYSRYDVVPAALQIKGIALLQKLKLDEIALHADYDLFVNENFSCFESYYQGLVRKELQRNEGCYFNSASDGKIRSKDRRQIIQYRKAIRRFYLFYSLWENAGDSDKLFNQLYGEVFSSYVKLTNMHITGKRDFAAVQNLVFNALYMENTGCLPSGNAVLPLTLRRQDDVFQNVMLVMGIVSKDELKIKQQRPVGTFDDNSDKQQLVLLVGPKERPFVLTLPLLTHYKNVVDGEIISNCNPALTHGAMRLDTVLSEEFSSTRAGELHVLVNTTKSQQRYKITLDTDYINMEGEN